MSELIRTDVGHLVTNPPSTKERTTLQTTTTKEEFEISNATLTELLKIFKSDEENLLPRKLEELNIPKEIEIYRVSGVNENTDVLNKKAVQTDRYKSMVGRYVGIYYSTDEREFKINFRRLSPKSQQNEVMVIVYTKNGPRMACIDLNRLSVIRTGDNQIDEVILRKYIDYHEIIPDLRSRLKQERKESYSS